MASTNNPSQPKTSSDGHELIPVQEFVRNVTAMLELLVKAKEDICKPETRSDGGGGSGSGSINNDRGSSSTNESNGSESNNGITEEKDKTREIESKRNRNGGKSQGSNGHLPSRLVADEFDKLRSDLHHIKNSLGKLTKLEVIVGENIRELKARLDKFLKELERPAPDQIHRLSMLRRHVFGLKIKIPSSHSVSTTAYSRRESLKFKRLSLTSRMKEKQQQDDFPFSILQQEYEGLDLTSKIWLLFFALFPKDAAVNRRLLTYLWVGGGFLEPIVGQTTAEELGNKVLAELAGCGFVEPVYKMGGLAAESFKIRHGARSFIISLAKNAGFFHFPDAANPTEHESSMVFHCKCGIAGNTTYVGVIAGRCGGHHSLEIHSQNLSKSKASTPISSADDSRKEKRRLPALEKLGILINLNNPFPDMEFESFSKMKNLTVLSLGRWQRKPKPRAAERSAAKHHTEIESTDFLKGLKNMKHLGFISLRGIFGIKQLPKSLSKLLNLKILDLRACPNLEMIPKEIALLKNLTHLDISECHLLQHMPMALSKLTNLQVLKGFVIGESHTRRRPCTLRHLQVLPYLRKLSIYITLDASPLGSFKRRGDQLNDLPKLAALRKLKIVWGGWSLSGRPDKQYQEENDTKQDNHEDVTPARDSSVHMDLEKLDLQCFPWPELPSVLTPGKLENLKKLYIRGGNLRSLANEWKEIQTLRLKFLNHFELKWSNLQELFPGLIYLEKVKCPKLALYPCDEKGNWLKGSITE